MNLEEATARALTEENIGDIPEAQYRAVEIKDANNEETVYRIIMLNNKHSVADFQQAIYDAYERNEEEISQYGDDVEVILGDIDPSFDWYELNYDDDYLTI